MGRNLFGSRSRKNAGRNDFAGTHDPSGLGRQTALKVKSSKANSRSQIFSIKVFISNSLKNEAEWGLCFSVYRTHAKRGSNKKQMFRQ